MLRPVLIAAVVLPLLSVLATGVDGTGELDEERPASGQPAVESAPIEESSDADPGQRSEDRSATLNLLGKTDTDAGESRRNENIQFNLIDNNALKELNLRLGTTATIIREFRSDTEYFGAEFGSAPRGPIHQVTPETRSTSIRGEVLYGHLNSATTARSFFQVGEVKPAREHEYGFRLSLPLWKGADFSLTGAQTKIRGQVNGNVLIPLAGERTPLTNDPQIAEVVNQIISAYPAALPNRTDIAERMLNTNSPQKIDNNDLGGRFHQDIGGNDQIVLRYDFLIQKVRAFQFVKGQNPDTQTRSHLARATWTHIWSPNFLADFSAGFDRLGSLLTPEENFIGFRASVSGVFEALGPGNAIPIDRTQNDFLGAAQFTALRGDHQVTFGFDGLRRQLNGIQSDAHLGHFRFSNNFGTDAVTNMRLGRPSSFFGGVGDTNRGFRISYWSSHVEDRWRMSPEFTLTLGLRWEMQSGPVEVNRLNQFPYGGDYNNFAPMASFAWSLNDRWGVLRGAYGLHYGEIFAVTAQQIRFNAPLNYKLVIQDPDILDPLGGTGGTIPPDTRSVLYDFIPDLVSPYSQQYNFSWEFSPARVLQVQLGYVGSRSLKLLHHWYENRGQPVPGVPQETGTIDERRADTRYTDIRRVYNGSRGYFDAAKATALLRNSKGLTGEFSYWFSKSIDLGASYTNTAQELDSFRNGSQYEFEVHRDMRGLSRFDQPHSFLARAGYEFPYRGRGSWSHTMFGDWSVSGVVLLKTGTPFSLSTGSDAPGFGNVDGINSDRPNVLDPSVLGRTIGHPDESVALLPRDAFSFVAAGEDRGNLGRHTFRRGSIRNVNMALSKALRLKPEVDLTLRAEAINLFNTPQFAEPGNRLTDPNFGVITNTLNEGRTIRFLLRLAF